MHAQLKQVLRFDKAKNGVCAVDLTEFRSALGRFATGVTIVTARSDDGEPVGATMSSFNTVSLKPPLILFSAGLNMFGIDILRHANGIAVNVLCRDQHELANNFGRPSQDKWNGVASRDGYGGAPLIERALAHFECKPYGRYDGGDHEIFVVEVVSFKAGRDADPLIFYNGRLRGLGEEYPEVPDWNPAYYDRHQGT